MPLLSIFGELERFIADDLYPYRYVITPLLVALIAAALFAAYRLGFHLVLMRHKVATAAIGVPLIALTLVAGDYLLSPLWERSFLEEESPLAAVATGGSTTPPAPTATQDAAAQSTPEATASASDGAGDFEPAVVVSGVFMGADDFHFGEGDALIIQTGPDTYVLRFENFSVRNGPDLFVYLSEDPSGESVDEALNLGSLKATDGAFNYEIPPEIDVSSVKSAVVWCRQFSVLFAHAELNS